MLGPPPRPERVAKQRQPMGMDMEQYERAVALAVSRIAAFWGGADRIPPAGSRLQADVGAEQVRPAAGLQSRAYRLAPGACPTRLAAAQSSAATTIRSQAESLRPV